MQHWGKIHMCAYGIGVEQGAGVQQIFGIKQLFDLTQISISRPQFHLKVNRAGSACIVLTNQGAVTLVQNFKYFLRYRFNLLFQPALCRIEIRPGMDTAETEVSINRNLMAQSPHQVPDVLDHRAKVFQMNGNVVNNGWQQQTCLPAVF